MTRIGFDRQVLRAFSIGRMTASSAAVSFLPRNFAKPNSYGVLAFTVCFAGWVRILVLCLFICLSSEGEDRLRRRLLVAVFPRGGDFFTGRQASHTVQNFLHLAQDNFLLPAQGKFEMKIEMKIHNSA